MRIAVLYTSGTSEGSVGVNVNNSNSWSQQEIENGIVNLSQIWLRSSRKRKLSAFRIVN